MFILWRLIMASDSVRRAHRFWHSAMTIVSLDIRAAVLIVAILVAPLTSAQDDTVQTPEHVVGVHAR